MEKEKFGASKIKTIYLEVIGCPLEWSYKIVAGKIGDKEMQEYHRKAMVFVIGEQATEKLLNEPLRQQG